MVTLGLWISRSNQLDSIEHGFLNKTATTFIDAGDSKCIHYGSKDYVCCVDTGSYLLGACPLVFDSNNYCVPPDASHVKGNMCIYSKFLSLEAKTGYYVKCTKKVCDQSITLYNECDVYSFKGKIFMYCSNDKVPNNQYGSINFSYKFGEYNLTEFENDAKFYDTKDLPVILDNEIISKKDSVERLKIAFIVLIILTGCFLSISIVSFLFIN